MTVNPYVQTFLDAFNAYMLTQPSEIPVEQGRQAYEMFAVMHSGVPLRMRRVEDFTIPNRDNSYQIPVRLYQPRVDTALPVLLYFHGGGWQRGSITAHDSICRHLAAYSECAVLSVEWRLAPEHRFPVGLEDCMDAYHWLRGLGAKVCNIDPARIGMGGDSAGGNMTAVTIQRLKKAGEPLPVFQLLLYPALDLSGGQDSYARYADGYFLGRERVKYYVDHYISSPDDIKNPLGSPLLTDDLQGLPPTHIVAAGYDPLRDEGKAYADKLAACGVPVTYKCYEDMIHAFLHMTGSVPEVVGILQEIGQRVKQGLRG